MSPRQAENDHKSISSLLGIQLTPGLVPCLGGPKITLLSLGDCASTAKKLDQIPLFLLQSGNNGISWPLGVNKFVSTCMLWLQTQNLMLKLEKRKFAQQDLN